MSLRNKVLVGIGILLAPFVIYTWMALAWRWGDFIIGKLYKP
jgi:hypothetical protein